MAELQRLLEAVNGSHKIPKIFPSNLFKLEPLDAASGFERHVVSEVANAKATSPASQKTPQQAKPQGTSLASRTSRVQHSVTSVKPATQPTVPVTTQKSSEKINDTMLMEARQPPSADKMELIQQVIETVTQAHLDTCNYTLAKVAAGKQMYEASKKGKSMAMPDMSKMSMQPGQMWEKLVSNMVPVIMRIVKFCKRLPGFMELAQEDQVCLIKQGSFEVVVARYMALFEEDGMYVPSMEIKIPRQVVKKMPMGEFFEQQFDLARTINALNLDDTEIAIFAGIMIINPERTGLINRQAVHKLQGLFLQSLYVYLQRRWQDGAESMFQRIIATLPDLQAINDNHSKSINSMQMKPDIKFPSLHEEVYRNAS